ncbi:MarR family winged helix-turn-helix transcriptional regulator [Stakelama marina]|uniref:MarR family transcriptional regulator n=1 Tax=Stakelama marina TaxID=2826939 RepID=A0A8T4I9T2_9SPHN|nr:MarR family transcriptional regulator [Stakelama marina]MBR0551778.1 MarR family transcriptional regulator [Stakelama marina]
MTETLGFLISDVSRLLRRRFDERARTIGVTRPQWRALTVLARNEGAHQGTLAELLEVEPISLCRMIDRLEEAGLVERRRDPADRRAWRIYLTDKAKPVIAKLKVMGQELTEAALEGISDADRARLTASIQAIRANLNVTDDISEETANG